MYRGGKICISDHFKPLWARNVPKFGIAHAMALGVSRSLKSLHLSFISFEQLGPWLAVEIPDLLAKGLIQEKTNKQ